MQCAFRKSWKVEHQIDIPYSTLTRLLRNERLRAIATLSDMEHLVVRSWEKFNFDDVLLAKTIYLVWVIRQRGTSQS